MIRFSRTTDKGDTLAVVIPQDNWSVHPGLDVLPTNPDYCFYELHVNELRRCRLHTVLCWLIVSTSVACADVILLLSISLCLSSTLSGRIFPTNSPI